MKRKSLWLVLLPALTLCAAAQESRQDISISGSGVIGVSVPGLPAATSNSALGGLVSYRFMVTPRSGLEANYQYSQTQYQYTGFYNCQNPNGSSCPSLFVHTRQQEISGAYVYNMTFGNFNPFAEAGVGGYVFSPIKDPGTSIFDVAQNTNIGAFYGVGVAYQISPSFDIRAEYRGLIIKIPSFSLPGARTGVYQNVSDPVIGIAYHF
jgi:opacity protein-like surface antigen